MTWLRDRQLWTQTESCKNVRGSVVTPFLFFFSSAPHQKDVAIERLDQKHGLTFMASWIPQGGVCWEWNVRSGQLISPSTATQGFSPGRSADGSLIYSRGGPLHKPAGPVEESLCFVPWRTVLGVENYIDFLKKDQNDVTIFLHVGTGREVISPSFRV